MPEMLNASSAAELLGVDKRTILRLARSGKIRSYRTPGGQHRFRREDVEMLAAGDGHAAERHSPPASHLQNKREEIESLNLEVQARRAKRDLERIEAEDAESERQRAETQRAEALANQRAVAELEQNRHQAESARERELQEAAAARQRREWEAEILNAALAAVPPEAPLNVKAAIGEAVRQALTPFGPGDSPALAATVAASAINRALAPWERSKEIERAIERARERVPWSGRGIVQPTEWETKALHAAAEAIRQLAPDASLAQIRAAAIEAGDRVAADYERWKAQDDHRRACEQIATLIFYGDEAHAAVRKALEKLPVGATHAEMEQARDVAIRPFEERAKAERDAEHYLAHVGVYVEKLGAPDREWDLGDYFERKKLAARLEKKIRPRFVSALLAGKIEDQHDAGEFIENAVDGELEIEDE